MEIDKLQQRIGTAERFFPNYSARVVNPYLNDNKKRTEMH